MFAINCEYLAAFYKFVGPKLLMLSFCLSVVAVYSRLITFT